MLYYINTFAVLMGVLGVAFVALTLTRLVRQDQLSEAAARREKPVSRYELTERAA